MHSNATSKNVSWPHFSWPTLYTTHESLWGHRYGMWCDTDRHSVDRWQPPVTTYWIWMATEQLRLIFSKYEHPRSRQHCWSYHSACDQWTRTKNGNTHHCCLK